MSHFWLSELTDDSSAKVEDLVKVGDELDLIVEKVMDQDGVIQLSRKKLASRKGMEEIAKAAESGEVVEGDVTEFNKGGVVVNVKGVKVFVPSQLADVAQAVHTDDIDECTEEVRLLTTPV